MQNCYDCLQNIWRQTSFRLSLSWIAWSLRNVFAVQIADIWWVSFGWMPHDAHHDGDAYHYMMWCDLLMFNLTLDNQQTCWWMPKMDLGIQSQGYGSKIIWDHRSKYVYYFNERSIWILYPSTGFEEVSTVVLDLLLTFFPGSTGIIDP